MSQGGALLRVTALAAMLALSACAGVRVAPAPARPLAPPADAGERAVSQVVRGGAGSREMTLSCVVSVKDGVMSLIGLSSMGVRLFTMSYDGKQVRVEKAAGLPEVITPDRLLADLQLVYWPLPSLQQALEPAGFRVVEPAPGTRKLLRGDQLIAEVHHADGGDHWHGRAWLVNLQYDYSLQIDSQPL